MTGGPIWAEAGNGTITGLVVAFVGAFSALIALVGWLVRHLFSVTIPAQTAAAEQALEKVAAGHRATLDKVIDHYDRESAELRKATDARVASIATAVRENNSELRASLATLHQDSRDIVHSIRSLAQVLNLRSYLADAVQSSDVPIWTKSLDGTIRSWNSACERLLGWTQGEVVGRNIREKLLPPQRQDEETDVMRRIAAGEMVPEYRTERLAKDGRSIPLLVVTSPTRDQAGRVTGASTVVREP